MDPLGKYKGDDITLELPGEETFFDIDWISVWDEERATNLGHVNIPDGLNIPPAIVKFHVSSRKSISLSGAQRLEAISDPLS